MTEFLTLEYLRSGKGDRHYAKGIEKENMNS